MEARLFEYLAAHYDRLSVQQQTKTLHSIIDRLSAKGLFGKELAMDMVKELEEDENYSPAQIMAHLDMLDLEDRI